MGSPDTGLGQATGNGVKNTLIITTFAPMGNGFAERFLPGGD
jgi:hypothetical protein